MLEILSSIIPKGTYIMSKELNDKKALVDLGLVYANNDTTIEIANEINIISYKVYIMQGEEYVEYELFDDEPKKHLDVGGLLLNVLAGVAICALCAVAIGFGIGLVIGAVGVGIASISASIVGASLATGTALGIIGSAVSAGASAAMMYGSFSLLENALKDVVNEQTSDFGVYVADAMYSSFSGGIANSMTSFGVLKGLRILTNMPNTGLFDPKNYEIEEEILNYFISTSIEDEIKEFFGEEPNEEDLATRYVEDKFNLKEIAKGKATEVIGKLIKKYFK